MDSPIKVVDCLSNICLFFIIGRGVDDLQLSIAFRQLAIVGEGLLEPIADIDIGNLHCQGLSTHSLELSLVLLSILQQRDVYFHLGIGQAGILLLGRGLGDDGHAKLAQFHHGLEGFSANLAGFLGKLLGDSNGIGSEINLIVLHSKFPLFHFYYLLAYDGKKMRVYRIDHMEGVEIEEADAEGLEEFKKINLSNYTKQTFGMYDGKVESVTMRFPNNMVGTVLDRFGREVTIMKADDRHFRITVPIAISPQFYGWVFGLKNYVTIESPQSVVDGMKEMLSAVGKRYEELQ